MHTGVSAAWFTSRVCTPPLHHTHLPRPLLKVLILEVDNRVRINMNDSGAC